jgi:hypothetical protein
VACFRCRPAHAAALEDRSALHAFWEEFVWR